MKTIKQTDKKIVTTGKQRSYNEIIELLDKNWSTNVEDKSLSCIKQLDIMNRLTHPHVQNNLIEFRNLHYAFVFKTFK